MKEKEEEAVKLIPYRTIGEIAGCPVSLNSHKNI